MASMLGLSEHQRLSIGDWQEQGKVSSMPVRYDDQKAQAATEAKNHAVVAVALYAGACARGECLWEFVSIEAHALDLPLSVPSEHWKGKLGSRGTAGVPEEAGILVKHG